MKKKFNLIRWSIALGIAEKITDKTYASIESVWSKISPNPVISTVGIIATTGAMMFGITYGTDDLIFKTENKIKELKLKKQKIELESLKQRISDLKNEETTDKDSDYSLKL